MKCHVRTESARCPPSRRPDQCFYDGAASYVDGSQRLRTRGLPSGQDHRGEGTAFTVGHAPPNAVERLVKLLFDGLQRVAESTLVGALAAAGSLPTKWASNIARWGWPRATSSNGPKASPASRAELSNRAPMNSARSSLASGASGTARA